MICGRRGDRGVCPMPTDHLGECETVHGQPIQLAVQERRLARYHRILSDLSFFLIFFLMSRMSEQKTEPE